MASEDKKKSRTGGIRTLSDLNRRSADSDSDSDGPPEYYTGGEKSGMLVQDPTKDNDVDSIFDQARELGATEGPFDPSSASSSSRSFAGTGRLLSGETVQPTPAQPETVVHNIIFWSNGFTINDGPLRRLDDPENASFLESIKKSECPKELEPADRSTSVHVNLIGPNTLKIIYDRGLIGSVHNWCEAYSTYPRTYDLLHAWTIFSDIERKGCSGVDLLIEMDRILRPKGFIIVRDNRKVVEFINKHMKALHWEAVATADAEGGTEKDDDVVFIIQKKIWRTSESFRNVE